MRVQVNLSDNMVKKIDTISENMGISRSAFCSFVIGQYVTSQEKSTEILKSVGLDIANEQVK